MSDAHLDNRVFGESWPIYEPSCSWWICPDHGRIEDGDEERDSCGDAVCPVELRGHPIAAGTICGKALEYVEYDGYEEDDFDE